MNRQTLAPSTPALSLRRNSLFLAVAATLSLPGSVHAADIALLDQITGPTPQPAPPPPPDLPSAHGI